MSHVLKKTICNHSCPGWQKVAGRHLHILYKKKIWEPFFFLTSGACLLTHYCLRAFLGHGPYFRGPLPSGSLGLLRRIQPSGRANAFGSLAADPDDPRDAAQPGKRQRCGVCVLVPTLARQEAVVFASFEDERSAPDFSFNLHHASSWPKALHLVVPFCRCQQECKKLTFTPIWVKQCCSLFGTFQVKWGSSRSTTK